MTLLAIGLAISPIALTLMLARVLMWVDARYQYDEKQRDYETQRFNNTEEKQC